MTDKLEDRWASRDFHVLLEVARRIDAGDRYVHARDVAEALDMPRVEVILAIDALHPGYVDGSPDERMSGRVDWTVVALTERGRRAVGVWPSGDSVDALVDALRQAEEVTEDPEEKGALRKAAGAVMGVGRDVMTDVVAAVIRQQMGV